uniref:Uncharacterized protein n=1 Tax=Meloidogyne enterolobii TaxID=390850 RepID=A0A6V7Y274_MELEN|nr:unnamed protein product [Meloidogyne enterolobii]
MRNQQKYGIKLDKEKIARNEGMRYMAKSCNNSLFVFTQFINNKNFRWGRWALRCNLSKDLITRSPVELHEVLNDPKLEVGAVEMLATDLFSVPYQSKREFVRPARQV